MRPVAKSLKQYGRGIAGGLLFSLPLLYTMEMWWAGITIRPLHIIIYILFTICLLVGYNYHSGMRKDTSWLELLLDSVEEVGLGLLIATMGLLVLGRIDFSTDIIEMAGKIVVEAMTVAIGVSVGRSQLGGDEDDKKDKGVEGKDQEQIGKLSQAMLALCGGVLIGSNLAPTEEIVVIGTSLQPVMLIILLLLSLLQTVLILYYLNFRQGLQPSDNSVVFDVTQTSLYSYLIALGASAAMLAFFGRFDGASLSTALSETIVLGVATSLGASAGRLLIK